MIQDLINPRWNNIIMQPDPGTPTPEPEPGEEEKEERAQLDTQMLYKRLEKYFFQKLTYPGRFSNFGKKRKWGIE